ncbi:MAG: 3'-5' exonuclease [Candidatus Yanofskybacteria bacterium]|nr:3'-5' exonuclease [Candidatus Yanofskybacteria bacterium]
MIKHILNRRPRKFQPNTGIKRRPLIFVDLEFSGLNMNNEVIEIGCLVVDPKTLKIKKEWLAKIKPENIKAAETSSLEIVGYSKDEWKDAVSLRDGMLSFNKIAKDGVLVGYNVAWDFMFLEKSFFELGIKPAFHWQILDVLSMAFAKFYKGGKIKGFRMREVEGFLKIKHGTWHNPLDDAKATYEMFLKIINLRKNGK